MSIRRSGGTPTTTVPPARPTKSDIPTLVALHEAELAARDLYQIAVDESVVSDEDAIAIVRLMVEHHRAYGQALSALLGKAATNVADAAIVAEHEVAFGSGATFAATANTLENHLITLHSDAIGVLEGTEGAALLASIVITEGRHAVITAELAGKTSLAEVLAGEVAK
jgi:Ferritin-like domain